MSIGSHPKQPDHLLEIILRFLIGLQVPIAVDIPTGGIPFLDIAKEDIDSIAGLTYG